MKLNKLILIMLLELMRVCFYALLMISVIEKDIFGLIIFIFLIMFIESTKSLNFWKLKETHDAFHAGKVEG